MPTDLYIHDDTYRALTKALCNVKPDIATGRIEPHCIADVLGEVGGIWPAWVEADVRARDRIPAEPAHLDDF